MSEPRRGTPVTPDDNCPSCGHAHFTVPCRARITKAGDGGEYGLAHCDCMVRFVTHSTVETAPAQKESHRIEYVERNHNGLWKWGCECGIHGGGWPTEQRARQAAALHLYPADTPEQTRIRAMRIGCEECGYVSDIPRKGDERRDERGSETEAFDGGRLG